jgi:hypothetical protein
MIAREMPSHTFRFLLPTHGSKNGGGSDELKARI